MATLKKKFLSGRNLELLCARLDISRTSLRRYINGERPVPLSVMLKMQVLSKAELSFDDWLTKDEKASLKRLKDTMSVTSVADLIDQEAKDHLESIELDELL